MMNTAVDFPRQKLSSSQKNKEWLKQNIDIARSISSYEESYSLRKSFKDKQTLINLRAGKLDRQDIEYIVNPLRLTEGNFPDDIQHIPYINSKLNLLSGLEAKRRFDYTVLCYSQEVLNRRDEAKKAEVFELLIKNVMSQKLDRQVMETELKKVEHFYRYTYKDLQERAISNILSFYWKAQDWDLIFNDGFNDATTVAEENYCVDIVGSQPRLRKVNPMTLTTLRVEDGRFLEKCDRIIEDSFMPINQVIDKYCEDLTEAQVKQLDEGLSLSKDLSAMTANNPANQSIILPAGYSSSILGYNVIELDSSILTTAFGSNYGERGWIRVTRTVWRANRKIGIRTYLDELDNEVKDFVSEHYKKQDTDISLKWIWPGEWWEATLIGDDIYTRMQPLYNWKTSGYVGTVYSNNSSQAESILSVAKPMVYLYDEIFHRMRKVLGRYMGPLMEMDFVTIPKGWSPSQWLQFALDTGFAAKDSFKAGEGLAANKLAMAANTTGKVLNLDLGNYVAQHVQLLGKIEQLTDKITGIPQQMEGQMERKELVGVLERTITQSSHQIEPLFILHDNTKKRVLKEFALAAIHTLRDKDNISMQNVLDDMSRVIFTVNGSELYGNDFDIVISNSRDDMEMKELLKQIAESSVKQGISGWKEIMDIWYSPSMAERRRKIEENEEAKKQAEQQQQQQIMQMEQQKVQGELQLEKDKIAQKDREAQLKSNTDIEVALIDAESKNYGSDMKRDGKTKDKEAKDKNIDTQKEKNEKDIELRNRQLEAAIEDQREKRRLKEEDMRRKKVSAK